MLRALLLLFLAVLLAPLLAHSDDVPQTLTEAPITAEDRDHWAFRPVRRPELPAVRNEGWCRTPVDRFILARLEAAGLSPLPEADRLTLLRRVTFDLTGLPPTVGEIDTFLADQAPGAYERVVDRLLASTAYGERWAQHWLDLARFAETDGFELDGERPNAWRYRDWVIEGLTRDLPFDEFVRLQLAGDELHPGDPSAMIATGFLLCGPDMPDINSQDERRSTYLNDLTGTVSAVLLGLQTGCAQCHDHKFDPISQADFYRLRAIFDPVEIFKDHPLPGQPSPPVSPELQAALEKLKSEESRIQTLEAGARQKLKEENPDLQPTRDDLVKALSDDERRAHGELSRSVAAMKKTVKLPEVPQGRMVREAGTRPKASHLLIRGDYRREGAEVFPAFLRIANSGGSGIAPAPAEAATTGRRKQLADWLVRPDHPLTGRVIVNRVWQHHFGRGLVETGSDFGRMGTEPTHPELLDWLTTEFPRQGWSLKALHKLMVTSAVYRQASRPQSLAWTGEQSDTAAASWKLAKKVDPENRLLSHMSVQRLDGEALRDAMLASAGRLSSARGGPGVRPPLPAELLSTLLKNQWNVTPNEADHRRRSIYLFVRRNLRYPLFEAFDRPDTNASCARRNRSTIAPQALILLNSEFSLAAARDLAGRLFAEAKDSTDARVTLAYRLTLGREPVPEERSLAATFLQSQTEKLRAAGRPAKELALPEPPPAEVDAFAAAAWTDFCLALYNSNEFVYVD